MSSVAAVPKLWHRPWPWIGASILAVLILAALSLSNRERRSSITAGVHSAQPEVVMPEGVGRHALRVSAMSLGGIATSPSPAPADRKIVRTSCMELTVASPADVAEKIRAFAESLGGYVETAQISGSQDAPGATMTIRVPASRLEDAKAELRKLSVKVNSEKADAQDVTKQYVDLEARIRNLQAQEAQYLEIMRSAKKVQDMLDVSEKVSEVRGEIEQQQAEFATLSKQVETVAITISLLPQAAPESFSLNWKPLHQLQVAGRDALEGIADYASTMAAVVLYMPVIMLWIGTIVLGIFASWRAVRWVGRMFSPFSKPAAPTTQPS